jgi:F-type H+-transporting ATPase subunit delta
VRLTTAVAINNDDLADIKQKLEGLTGKQVDIDSRVDTTLIGGAKAQIGSTIYDGTIKNQLNKMRNQLMS